MKVLLTNDDGVDAEGIAAVRATLMDAGATVVTIAPGEDCSGYARRCTFSRRLEVRRVVGGPHPTYACDGTPTDCVRLGLLAGLAEGADLVVSGVNHGANLADDILYSGTVGAGLEAGLLGTPALCLSQQTPTGSFSVNYRESRGPGGPRYDFAAAAEHGAGLAVRLARRAGGTEPVVLSVNYPARLRDPRPLVTRPGGRAYPRASAPWGPDEQTRQVWVFGAPDEEIPESDNEQGTDLAALRAGRISVSPLASGYAVAALPDDLVEALTG